MTYVTVRSSEQFRLQCSSELEHVRAYIFSKLLPFMYHDYVPYRLTATDLLCVECLYQVCVLHQAIKAAAVINVSRLLRLVFNWTPAPRCLHHSNGHVTNRARPYESQFSLARVVQCPTEYSAQYLDTTNRTAAGTVGHRNK